MKEVTIQPTINQLINIDFGITDSSDYKLMGNKKLINSR
jgi:hypothetical protein